MTSDCVNQCSSASLEESKDESQKPKFTYTRDFLLSFSDTCATLPVGFNSSILSEFEDSSQSAVEPRQRASGGLPLQRFSSTPLNRANNSSNYSRVGHGRWDTRSSGSNDKDGDSSDQDSATQDSGRRYGNHSRRPWQQPEHDGLLGSGAFPRPSGYVGGASASRVRGSDNYQLNRSSEPYHPPRYYKASRQDTDSRNDETFGSTEVSSEDRIEEERKRRESFELMRKEQQKALKEKQKHPEHHKEQSEGDIVRQLKGSEDDRSEDLASFASQGDSAKPFPAQAPASRPLVPPGFTKNVCAKSSVQSTTSMVVNCGNEDKDLSRPNASGDNQGSESEKQTGTSLHSHEQKHETKSVGVPFVDAIEKTSIPSSDAVASDSFFGFEKTSYQSSCLLEVGEGWAGSTVAGFDSEKKKRFEVGTAGQDQSTSILEKLFTNAVAVNNVASPGLVEQSNDVKSDGNALNSLLPQDSKFAHWFFEEEGKEGDDVSTSKARDLLSLIANHDNVRSQVSAVYDEKDNTDIPISSPFEDTEVSQKFITSVATSTAVGITEPFYHSDKPDVCSGVLTCEDLEQSILAEVKEHDSYAQNSVKEEWNFFDAKVAAQKSDVDNQASQHLLSLLQMGTMSKGITTSTGNLDMGSSDKLTVPDIMIGTIENVNNSEKTLTLEALFGTAFMKELHSVEAPLSVHRGPAGGVERTGSLEPDRLPFAVGDDVFYQSSNKPNILQVPQPDTNEGNWLNFNYSQPKGPKLETAINFEGKTDGRLEIRLPEEESLIAMGDPSHHETSQLLPMGSAPRTKELVSSEPPVEIIDKLAALSAILKDERSVAPNVGQPVFHNPYGTLEHDMSYHHLQGQPPSPQFPHQINARPLNSLDQNALRNPQMKFVGPDGIHDSPRHVFQPNIHPPFHGIDGPRFEPAHHSALQPVPTPGSFPPPQMLHGLPPRGVPSPHPFNHMPGYLPEMNPFQGFPQNHQQANYGGLGMGLPGPGVGAGNHPEIMERLIEMELRGNQKQRPPVAAGHGLGICAPELDMALRYR